MRLYSLFPFLLTGLVHGAPEEIHVMSYTYVTQYSITRTEFVVFPYPTIVATPISLTLPGTVVTPDCSRTRILAYEEDGVFVPSPTTMWKCPWPTCLTCFTAPPYGCGGLCWGALPCDECEGCTKCTYATTIVSDSKTASGIVIVEPTRTTTIAILPRPPAGMETMSMSAIKQDDGGYVMGANANDEGIIFWDFDEFPFEVFGNPLESDEMPVLDESQEGPITKAEAVPVVEETPVPITEPPVNAAPTDGGFGIMGAPPAEESINVAPTDGGFGIMGAPPTEEEPVVAEPERPPPPVEGEEVPTPIPLVPVPPQEPPTEETPPIEILPVDEQKPPVEEPTGPDTRSFVTFPNLGITIPYEELTKEISAVSEKTESIRYTVLEDLGITIPVSELDMPISTLKGGDDKVTGVEHPIPYDGGGIAVATEIAAPFEEAPVVVDTSDSDSLGKRMQPGGVSRMLFEVWVLGATVVAFIVFF